MIRILGIITCPTIHNVTVTTPQGECLHEPAPQRALLDQGVLNDNGDDDGDHRQHPQHLYYAYYYADYASDHAYYAYYYACYAYYYPYYASCAYYASYYAYIIGLR